MRILIIIDFPAMGGAERVAFTLSEWLNNQVDVHATVVGLHHFQGATYDTEGRKYVELRKGPVILRLRKIVKVYQADVVLTMGTPLSIITVPALWGLKVKHVVSERNDPSHFSGKVITRILSRCLMKFADGYVFQTKQAQQFYKGFVKGNSVIIHNPLCKIPNNYEKTYSDWNNIIVNVGRLTRQKNQRLLINSFAEFLKEYPDYILQIWGEGSDRESLQTYIKTLNLEGKVLMPGNTENIFDVLKKASIFVLSSDFEGMPNALMEAMSIGLPCISTNCPCGGAAELIKNEENGLLVPVNDRYALVRAMKYFANDRSFSEKVGRSASLIRETHHVDVICQQWLSYFRNLLE